MLIPKRHESSDKYRYGFQGQEKDDEVKGEGNSINYKFRMHDPRVGRFFAVDPLTAKYPWYTPYSFSGNKVVNSVELEGKEDTRTIVFNTQKEATPIIIAVENKDALTAIALAQDAINNGVASEFNTKSNYEDTNFDVFEVAYRENNSMFDVNVIFKAKKRRYSFLEKFANWYDNNATGGICFSDGGNFRDGIAGKAREGNSNTWMDWDGSLSALVTYASVGREGTPGSGGGGKGIGTNGGANTIIEATDNVKNAIGKTSSLINEIGHKVQKGKDTTVTIPTLTEFKIVPNNDNLPTTISGPGNIKYKTTTDKVQSLQNEIRQKNQKTEKERKRVVDSIIDSKK